MDAIIVGPEDGEQAGTPAIPCRIIEDGSHTEHRLGLVEVTVRPGPAMPPQHTHGSHEEVFIMTRGRLRFTAGSESADAGAGACVIVPAGVPHTFSNPFDEPAAFICTMTPDLYIPYFRDLREMPAGPNGLPNPADIGRTMARYDTKVVAPVAP